MLASACEIRQMRPNLHCGYKAKQFRQGVVIKIAQRNSSRNGASGIKK